MTKINAFRIEVPKSLIAYVNPDTNVEDIHYSWDENREQPVYFPQSNEEAEKLDRKGANKEIIEKNNPQLVKPFLKRILVDHLKTNKYTNYGSSLNSYLPNELEKKEEAIPSGVEEVEIRPKLSIKVDNVRYNTEFGQTISYLLIMDYGISFHLTSPFQDFEDWEHHAVYARESQDYYEGEYLGKIQEVSKKGIETTKGIFPPEKVKVSTSKANLKEILGQKYTSQRVKSIIKKAEIALGDYNQRGNKNSERGHDRMNHINSLREDFPNSISLLQEKMKISEDMMEVKQEE